MNRRDALQTFALTGGALTTGSFEQLLAIGQSLRTGTPQPRQLRVLDGPAARATSLLAEIIVPRTDLPGATDVDVTSFIDGLLAGWLDAEERDAFLAGLHEVDQRAQREYDAVFAECAGQQQLALVTAMDAEVAALLQAEEATLVDEYVETSGPASRASSHFFYQMKRLTLIGYFTSEPGMRQALGYRAFPGRWQPCVVLDRERP